MELLKAIPTDLTHVVQVIVFSLLIGLEQRRHHIHEEFGQLFGTDRTFTLIGILGCILYVLDPLSYRLFIGGGAALVVLLGIYYFQRSSQKHHMGLTSLITALITYCLAPLVYTQPGWLVVLILVVVLILTEIKEDLSAFSRRFDDREFITLATFLGLSGVVLPLLPTRALSAQIPISLYGFWMAVVAVSGISYLSYLLQKFVFPTSGMQVTGLLGGLYSSTATTVILARRAQQDPSLKGPVLSAMFLASAMMYVRIFILSWMFYAPVARLLVIPFVLLTLACLGLSYMFRHRGPMTDGALPLRRNPLELRTALGFAGLFVLFALATSWVLGRFGSTGMQVLSFVVGVTDIDPFILNLLQGHWTLEVPAIALAILNATTSNNVLKMVYAMGLAPVTLRKRIAIGFGVLVVLGLAWVALTWI